MKISTLFRTLACLCALAAAASVSHAAPRSVRAAYQGFMNGLPIGTITELFESDGATYRIVSDTKPTGLAALIQRQPLRFTSAGQLAREGLKPVQFEARRSSAADSPSVTAEFNWQQKQLTLKHDGKIESVSLEPGTQDRLSVMYQFMFVAPERLRHLDFPMTNGRRLSHYSYRRADDAEIETGLGRLRTLHLVKQRESDEPVSEVWLSPQHQNLPVKLLIIERDGMRFEQVLQSVEIRD